MFSRLSPAHRAMAAFALHASTMGTLFSRLPEVQQAMALTEGTFALVLLGMPAGLVTGSFLMPPVLERFGPRLVLLWGLPATGLLTVPAALTLHPALLAATITAFGFLFASGNLASNVEADRIEVAGGRRIMNRCHGWWALGYLAASAVAPALIALDVPPVAHFGGLGVGMVLLTPALLRDLPVSAARPTEQTGRPRVALPDRTTLLICAYAAAGIALEGTTRSWAVIYVRDIFGAPDWLAALALPAVVVTMMIGRFMGDRAVSIHGDVKVGRAMGTAMLAGMVIVAVAPVPGLAFAGFALIGFGMSIVMPQGFSASARRSPRPAAEAMGAFATVTTLIGFVSPSVYGAFADVLDLRMALVLFLPLPIIAIVFARELGRTSPTAPKPAPEAP